MNIFVLLNSGDFARGRYAEAISHGRHTVVYMGTETALFEVSVTCQNLILKNHLSCEEMIEKFVRFPLQFDRIVATKETDLLNAGRLRDMFKIEGIGYEDEMKVRDKMLMKELVSQAGIRVPKNYTLLDILKKRPQDLPILFKGKAVLKAIRGAGSLDMQIFESIEQLYEAVIEKNTGITALDEDKAFSDFKVEEFIEGNILHVDGFVQAGKVVGSLASQYIGTCYDFNKYGAAMGTFHIRLTRELAEISQRIVAASGIESGVFHLELFATSQGIYFLEVANRCGGAAITERFELATGLSLRIMQIKSLLGESVDMPFSVAKTHQYGEFLFPSHHLECAKGSVLRLSNTSIYKKNPLMIRWQENPVKYRSTSSYRAENNAISGLLKETSAEMKAFLEEMFKNIQVQWSQP